MSQKHEHHSHPHFNSHLCDCHWCRNRIKQMISKFTDGKFELLESNITTNAQGIPSYTLQTSQVSQGGGVAGTTVSGTSNVLAALENDINNILNGGSSGTTDYTSPISGA